MLEGEERLVTTNVRDDEFHETLSSMDSHSFHIRVLKRENYDKKVNEEKNEEVRRAFRYSSPER